jgi:hypothetical protein
MLKKYLFLVVAILLASGALGCGGDKDKGIYKDKDRQKVEDKGK